MASGQTTNYGLNQWQPTDPILREQFNRDNAKIDGELGKKLYISLCNTILRESKKQLDLTVSNLNLTDYQKLELFINIPSVGQEWQLLVNQDTEYVNGSFSQSQSGSGACSSTSSCLAGATSGMSFELSLFPPAPGVPVGCRSFVIYQNINGRWGWYSSFRSCMNVCWEQVETFNLVAPTGELPAGSQLTLCGMRKVDLT